MIDDACATELQGLRGQEETLRAEILLVLAASDQLNALQHEARTLDQELNELERQWQARQEVQAEAQHYQRAEIARQYHEQVRQQFEDDEQALNNVIERLSSRGALNDAQVETWPQADWFNAFTRAATTLRQTLAQEVAALADRLRQESHALDESGGSWPRVAEELNTVKAAFLTACHDRGLQPQDVARMQEIDRQRNAKQQILKERQARIEAIKPQVAQRDALLQQMEALWAQQFALRREVAREISQKADGAIRVLLEPMADEGGFSTLWAGMAPDGRGKLGRAWSFLGEVLFASFQETIEQERPESPSPWAHIKAVLSGERELPLELVEYRHDLRKYITDHKEAWRTTRLTRVEDRVDIQLYRSDGSLVGSILSRALSEGQRNTAVLNLLLAKGDGPIVIDQPEDELDSNFIYRELVPLLRTVKNQRQLILSTHNANMPVNADADFVYALDVKDGKGIRLAVGGLDVADTTSAVLNIMEGSAEAFKRRFEKYHF